MKVKANSTLFFEKLISLLELRKYLQKNMGYHLFFSLFSARLLSIFPYFFFSFCIATCFLFSNRKIERQYKDLKHLLNEKPKDMFLLVHSSVRVQYFYMDLNKKYVVVYYQCRSNIFEWCVHES